MASEAQYHISPELFAHLVRLAALELSPEEAEYLRRELNRQLDVIQELAAIPIPDDTPITSHGIPYPRAYRAPLREDQPHPFPHREEMLAQAPEVDEDGYVVVPDIPHETLS